MSDRRGFFITFEGIEGSGKTTHAHCLFHFLVERGFPCLLTREPGGTPLGEELRKILLSPSNRGIDGLTEALLFGAARREHVKKVIAPALREGKVVICVRYVDSTLAYQGYGRKIPLSFLALVNEMVTGNIFPDLTIFLDVEPEIGVRRSLSATQREELRFEEEFLQHRELLEIIRKGYLEIAAGNPERFYTVSTTWCSKEEVSAVIQNEVLRRMEKGGLEN